MPIKPQDLIKRLTKEVETTKKLEGKKSESAKSSSIIRR